MVGSFDLDKIFPLYRGFEAYFSETWITSEFSKSHHL